MTAVGGAPPRSNAVRWAAVGVGVVMALLVVMLITAKNAGDRPSASPVVGKQAPALDGKPLIGERFDIGANDRWLLVNFFATWCGPCVQEHPELRRFAEDMAEGGRGRVVSVAYDDEPTKVKEFFDQRGGDWTVLDADDGRTALDWGVPKVPESFLVAPNGVVVQRIQGGVRAIEVERIIAEAESAAPGDSGGGGAGEGGS